MSQKKLGIIVLKFMLDKIEDRNDVNKFVYQITLAKDVICHALYSPLNKMAAPSVFRFRFRCNKT